MQTRNNMDSIAFSGSVLPRIMDMYQSSRVLWDNSVVFGLMGLIPKGDPGYPRFKTWGTFETFLAKMCTKMGVWEFCLVANSPSLMWFHVCDWIVIIIESRWSECLKLISKLFCSIFSYITPKRHFAIIYINYDHRVNTPLISIIIVVNGLPLW